MNKISYAIALITSISFCVACIGQAETEWAALDSSNNITVGETVFIKSQFEGFPLVEPHLSAHPSDNNHLLASAMVVTDVTRPYESCRLSSFISEDGGKSWQEKAHDWWGYDPWTAILPNGQTVMSWIGTQGSFQGRYPIQFFFSEDGGKSWKEEVQTLEGNHDGTKIVALGNEFYFTTVRFREHMGADVVLYHQEGPAPFEEVALIDGKGQRLNFCEPAFLKDGTLLVPASHFLRKIWVQRYDPTAKGLSYPYTVSIQAGGAKGYMRMVADHSPTSPYHGRVYFVRALGSGNNYEGIWLNYSSDKGRVWSADKRVDLFESPAPGRAMAASAAVNKNGVLGISWVDSQEHPGKNDVYFTISLDGGSSFQRPVKVTRVSTDPKTEGNADVANKFPAGGHYLGLAARPDGSFQLIWSDSRSGIFELAACNITIR